MSDLGKVETATLGAVCFGLVRLHDVCGFVSAELESDLSEGDVTDALKRLIRQSCVEMFFWDATAGEYVPHSFENGGNEELFYFVGTEKGLEEYKDNWKRWFPGDE